MTKARVLETPRTPSLYNRRLAKAPPDSIRVNRQRWDHAGHNSKGVRYTLSITIPYTTPPPELIEEHHSEPIPNRRPNAYGITTTWIAQCGPYKTKSRKRAKEAIDELTLMLLALSRREPDNATAQQAMRVLRPPKLKVYIMMQGKNSKP